MNAQECLKELEWFKKNEERAISSQIYGEEVIRECKNTIEAIDYAISCVQAIERAGNEMPQTKFKENGDMTGDDFDNGYDTAHAEFIPILAKRLLEIDELKAEVERLKGGLK